MSSDGPCADDDAGPRRRMGAKSYCATNYSMMSSSAIRRPDGLRTIDDHFERLYEEEYDDSQIGDDADCDVTFDDEQKQRLLAPNSSRLRQLLDAYKDGSSASRSIREVCA